MPLVLSSSCAVASINFHLHYLLGGLSFFRFVIHFELNFCEGFKFCVKIFFFFLQVDTHLFQHHFFERLSFLHGIAFAPLSKIGWLYSCESVSGLSALSLGVFVYSLSNTILSWLLWLYSLEVEKLGLPALPSSFNLSTVLVIYLKTKLRKCWGSSWPHFCLLHPHAPAWQRGTMRPGNPFLEPMEGKSTFDKLTLLFTWENRIFLWVLPSEIRTILPLSTLKKNSIYLN